MPAGIAYISGISISGELSAITAEFVQSAKIADMFAGIAGIAENSQILDNTQATWNGRPLNHMDRLINNQYPSYKIG